MFVPRVSLRFLSFLRTFPQSAPAPPPCHTHLHLFPVIIKPPVSNLLITHSPFMPSLVFLYGSQGFFFFFFGYVVFVAASPVYFSFLCLYSDKTVSLWDSCKETEQDVLEIHSQIPSSIKPQPSDVLSFCSNCAIFGTLRSDDIRYEIIWCNRIWCVTKFFIIHLGLFILDSELLSMPSSLHNHNSTAEHILQLLKKKGIYIYMLKQ